METYCRGDAASILNEIGKIGLDKCAIKLAEEFTLSEEFLYRLGHLLDIRELSRMIPMSVKVYKRYIDRIDWCGVICNIELDEAGVDFLMEHIEHTTPMLFTRLGDTWCCEDKAYINCDMLSTLVNNYLGRELMLPEHWNMISSYHYLDSVFMRKYNQYLNWRIISDNNVHIPTDLLASHATDIDWRDIWYTYEFTCDEIDELVSVMNDKHVYIDWGTISNRQKLTEEFMDKYEDSLVWAQISLYQNMSLDFLLRHKDKINVLYLLRNINTDRHIIDEYITSIGMPNGAE